LRRSNDVRDFTRDRGRGLPTLEQADRVAEELKRTGLPADDVGVFSGADEPECRSESGITGATRAGVGMLAGGALGGLAGGPPGLLAGTLLGAFIDLGVPEDAACFYRDEQRAGRTVVLARSPRPDEAADLLRRLGANEVRVMADEAKKV
jgi:hypothetical protein